MSAKGYGSAVITIKAAKTKGYQAAKRTVKLEVVPKKVVLTKGEWRKREEKKDKVAYYEWKKVPSVSDYQCCFSYNKDFTEPAYRETANTHVILSSFPDKNRIYMRVRARKFIGAKKYYGDWSTAWVLIL